MATKRKVHHHRRRSRARRSNPRHHRRMHLMNRRNPHRIRRYHRRRNPSFGGMSTTDLLYMGGGALVNGVACRALPQALLPQYNAGIAGYGLNGAFGAAGAWLIGKFNRRAGQGAWIGLIVALGQRIIADKFGSGSAGATGGMSGDLDFSLGYYDEGPFPMPQGASAGPYGKFPGTPWTGNASFPTTAASAVRAGQAAAAAALAPASTASTGAASPALAKAATMHGAGWDNSGWS